MARYRDNAGKHPGGRCDFQSVEVSPWTSYHVPEAHSGKTVLELLHPGAMQKKTNNIETRAGLIHPTAQQ